MEFLDTAVYSLETTAVCVKELTLWGLFGAWLFGAFQFGNMDLELKGSRKAAYINLLNQYLKSTLRRRHQPTDWTCAYLRG